MSELKSNAIPRGFRFGAVKAGLKASGRPDFALIVGDEPASAAAAFTSNRVIAAPLIVDKENLCATGGRVRVAAINSGNANCAAGEAGLRAARDTCAAVARTFGCRAEEVFPSSTGIIGIPLPAEKLIAALPELAASLGSEASDFSEAAHAILTTDLVEKMAFARLDLTGTDGAGSEVRGEIRIAAFGKGSGMIHPQLVPHAAPHAARHATMLVYVLTDAAIEPAVVDGYLRGQRGQLAHSRCRETLQSGFRQLQVVQIGRETGRGRKGRHDASVAIPGVRSGGRFVVHHIHVLAIPVQAD